MAVTITDLPDYLHFTVEVEDIQKQRRRFSGYLTAHADDNLVNEVQDNFGSMLDDIEACCGVKVSYALLENIVAWSWTSNKTAESAQFATVDQILALNFERANPLKPKGKLNATVPLFSPTVTEAVLNFPNAGQPNLTNQPLIDIIDYFQKRITVRYDGNGLLYNGFTFQAGDTVTISTPDIVDNN